MRSSFLLLLFAVCSTLFDIVRIDARVSEGVSNELEVHYEERELLADLPFQISGAIIISYKNLIGSVNLPPQYSIHFEFEFN